MKYIIVKSSLIFITAIFSVNCLAAKKDNQRPTVIRHINKRVGRVDFILYNRGDLGSGGVGDNFNSEIEIFSDLPIFSILTSVNRHYETILFESETVEETILDPMNLFIFLSKTMLPVVKKNNNDKKISEDFFNSILESFESGIPLEFSLGQTSSQRLNNLLDIHQVISGLDFSKLPATSEAERRVVEELLQLQFDLKGVSKAEIDTLERRLLTLENEEVITIDTDNKPANDSDFSGNEDDPSRRDMIPTEQPLEEWVGFPGSSLNDLDSGIVSGDFEEDERANLTSGVFDSDEGEVEAMVFDLHEQASEDIVTINVKDVLGVGFILGAAVLTAPITGPVVGSAIVVSGLLGWTVLR